MRLAEHVVMAKAECQKHFQELEVLKEFLTETEKHIETAWLVFLKFQVHQELPRNLGCRSPRDEVPTVQQEKNTMMEGPSEADLMTIWEEILPTVMEGMD